MARTDAQYGRDPALPVSKHRWSIDSGSRSFSKLSARKGSKASSMEGQSSLNDAGLASAQEPLPFPEYSERSLPPEWSGNGRTSNTPSMNQGESAEQYATRFLLADDFADGVGQRSHRPKHPLPKVHIKPMLRKMSRDDATQSIDLSRSSTEQEGLGIILNLERDRRPSDSLASATYHRSTSGVHRRSTSGTSQFSTATGSSGGKPGSQYVHPMRPTPRVYTPPLSQSYQTSINESDSPDDGSPETQAKILSGTEHHRTVRASSTPLPRLSLQMDDDSFTRLPGVSQTNVSGRPSFGYSRDNGSTVDTASPISRPSLDFVFRSRTQTSMDPVSRAATIQAARHAFEEKEAAKTRRLEKQQLKAQERQTRRLTKRNSPECQSTPAVQSRENISEKKPENPGRPPKEPKRPELKADPKPSASFKSQTKSTWVLFMTWLRTRVFKFRRRLRKIA